MSALPAVFRLGFVERGTDRLEDALAYYTEVIGAKLVETGGAGEAYLSLGLHHHDLALREIDQPDASIIGFQVRPDLPLDVLERRLRAAGFGVEAKSDARPGTPSLLETRVAGHTFQLFGDMTMPAPGFADRGIVPNRIGHVALLTPEAGTLVRFFRDGLGFAETDWFDRMVTFLTCNRDHHVMNVVEAPIAKIHHVAFELRGQSQQFRAADLLARNARPIVWGPSRHTAGHNLASYHYGPDHLLVELYTDMDVFVREGGYFEPRPWHDSLPQRPKRWPLSHLTTWETPFGFDFSKA